MIRSPEFISALNANVAGCSTGSALEDALTVLSKRQETFGCRQSQSSEMFTYQQEVAGLKSPSDINETFCSRGFLAVEPKGSLGAARLAWASNSPSFALGGILCRAWPTSLESQTRPITDSAATQQAQPDQPLAASRHLPDHRSQISPTALVSTRFQESRPGIVSAAADLELELRHCRNLAEFVSIQALQFLQL